MPHWTAVVLGRPDFGGSVVFEEVDVERHRSRRTEHVVPEFQAERSVVQARRAQEAGRISVGHAVSLDVHVETSCRDEAHIKVNSENADAALVTF